MTELTPVPEPPKAATMLTAADVIAGPPIDPLKRIRLYHSTDWEAFTQEWAFSALKAVYIDVQSFAGAGDKGVDIAGITDAAAVHGVWDNFQCKHYAKPIAPSDIWVEIGKMLWYSFKGDFKPPRRYEFVAPQGVGTKLQWLLNDPAKLKSGLLEAWQKYCQHEITSIEQVKLEGAFKAYCEAFDYSIFKSMQPIDILEQHKDTPYYLGRFGGGLPQRPSVDAPPDEVGHHESRYVEQLLEAYSDHAKEGVSDLEGLKKFSKLQGHFKRQREAFYHAESLRVFVRDKTEPGTYESLQEQIYKGVVDTHDSNHPDGFERVKAVTKAAQDLSLQAHPLAPSTQLEDRHGVCHQLANEDRLKWKT